MDDFELQQELEAMAGAAMLPVDEEDQTDSIEVTTARWAKLFKLSEEEALDRIVHHRNDLARARVLDEHWSAVRDEMTAGGYDREAYEYELNLEKQKAAMTRAIPAQQDAASSMRYLVELKGPLMDAERVRDAAGLVEIPPVVSGRSAETWDGVQLCCIDAEARARLLKWAIEEGRGYEPTILVDPRSME